MEQVMRRRPGQYSAVRAVSLGVLMVMAAACGQTSAAPSEPGASLPAGSASSGCSIPLPDGIPAPENLVIESCQQSDKMTTFRGTARTAQDVDTVFWGLKSAYASAGYTLYENSNGKIRSAIFGGLGHRKGEIQLKPDTGFLSVSINLYPEDMDQ